MTSHEKKIAFGIEVGRILELLADQIYQSPLALLRENTQNSFDAVQRGRRCNRNSARESTFPLPIRRSR